MGREESPVRETERGSLRYDGRMSQRPSKMCAQMNETVRLMRASMVHQSFSNTLGPRSRRLVRIIESLELSCPQDQGSSKAN